VRDVAELFDDDQADQLQLNSNEKAGRKLRKLFMAIVERQSLFLG